MLRRHVVFACVNFFSFNTENFELWGFSCLGPEPVMSETASKDDVKSSAWNHHPSLPLEPVPYWYWPPQPLSLAKWLFNNFLTFSDRVIYIAYSIVVALWLMPFSGAEAALVWDWPLLILLRNFVVVLLVVGGLHIWFYGVDGQGNVLRYDSRPITDRKSATFTFGYQTWDNMFFTLVSDVPIATTWEVAVRYGYANGWASSLSFAEHPIWFLLLFPLLSMWQGIHFYFIHRLLHWPPLYRWVHAIHHRNVNTDPGPACPCTRWSMRSISASF